ncbi:hypothetical protein BACI71_110544 [Bacillus mycoides]|uniref:Uncharacterized protein n=1 Tax=Bacillus mycoides TaxID=1405 RepID=A0A653QV84_BACMY|nr:hypothetical protein BACI71_110544 [Bacillus mycoides]
MSDTVYFYSIWKFMRRPLGYITFFCERTIQWINCLNFQLVLK